MKRRDFVVGVVLVSAGSFIARAASAVGVRSTGCRDAAPGFAGRTPLALGIASWPQMDAMAFRMRVRPASYELPYGVLINGQPVRAESLGYGWFELTGKMHTARSARAGMQVTASHDIEISRFVDTLDAENRSRTFALRLTH